MRKYIGILCSAILAGFMISLGGGVFLAYKNVSLFGASFLFSLGLFMIITLKLHLYTGKVGYIFENKIKFLIELLLTYVGNIIGVVACGYAIRLTRLDSLINVSNILIETKLNDSPLSLFILSIFCGFLIFLAVEVQKKEVPGVFKFFAIVAPITVFLTTGYEHSIADAFYFSLSNMWTWKSILYLLIISIGNGIGSLLLWSLLRIYEKYVLNKKADN